MFHNNHRSTDPSAITCNMKRFMVMIDIHANEFAESTRSSKLSKVIDESCREACEADDSSVDIDNECMGSVYLRASG